ncbi:flavodoxin [Calidifontibacillus erzurumensis]|uniref:Flavodoxin n=1 Tax=Calidifontibacillus erzurumensis TaxID=2741433 RepID=A0A8J8GE49_9BACI|nr:flavodoxin [Calidifontibacillus erzurumensis]NSL50221.1 flavodoxin [Calidifontibacillus erzurumensis]
MARIIMIYASMTGNTEMMANAVAEGVREAGEDIDVVDIMEGPDAHDLESYEGILLGAYTWGDGDLPDDFLDFYDEMSNIQLIEKKAAVFGSCDSAYPNFGAAVDILMEKLSEQGAQVYPEGLKIELTPGDDELETCRSFGKKFVDFLRT